MSSDQGFQPSYDNWRDKTADNQEQGWKALIRAAGASAIRFHTVSNYDYIIRNYVGESFAGLAGPKTFKARKDGLNYRMLLPGSYTIEFLVEGQIVKSAKFDVGAGVTDLGRF